MAANTRDPELGDLADFVNELGRRAGFPSDAAWARAANYPGPNLSELRSGKAGVSGKNLVALIKAAADRIHEDEVAVALQAPPSQTDLREALERLEALVGHLRAAQDDPPDAPAQGSRA